MYHTLEQKRGEAPSLGVSRHRAKNVIRREAVTPPLSGIRRERGYWRQATPATQGLLTSVIRKNAGTNISLVSKTIALRLSVI